MCFDGADSTRDVREVVLLHGVGSTVHADCAVDVCNDQPEVGVIE